jgi:hypothetical protein
MIQAKQQQPTDKKREKILVIILLVVFVLSALLLSYQLMSLVGAKGTHPEKVHKIGFRADDNSTDGTIKGKSKKEIIAALNKKVAEMYNTITMNPNPIFADGKAKGTLDIINIKNHYPQVYEIYLKDTNQMIYTGGVEVGHKIETSNLLVDLPKGDYTCYLKVYLVDPATGDRIGMSPSTPDFLKVTVLS